MKGRWLYFVLMVAVLFSAPLAYAAPVSADQVKNLERQAEERQQEHKKLQAEAMQLNLDLTKLNNQLVSAAKDIQKEETSATKAEEDLKKLQKDLDAAEKKFAAENQKLAEMLAALQNLALHPTHSMLVMPLTPVEVVRSAVLMRESVPYLDQHASQLKKDLEELEKKQQNVRRQIAKLDQQKADLTRRQKQLRSLVDQKTALRKKIEGESQKTKKEALKLAAQASDLRDLLEKAEKEQELRRRKQEERRRAAQRREEASRQKQGQDQRVWNDEPTQTGKAASVGVSGGKSVNFKAAYGKLTKPVSGSIMTAYGEELSKGVNSKGLVIKTRAGAQVVAPYDGTVIFSGPFKGYGNLIIVEHGQGYVSLLAGMSSVETETGQMILTGEPVGVMPETPSAKLYIEIRQNQRPINPAPWFGRAS
jgi:septal ring factor EnvC (AmiA/AmiB activator)